MDLIRKFEEITENRGASKAIEDAHGSLTYGELNAKASALASILSKDQITAVFLEPSCDFVVAIISVLKAGGIYLPLDTQIPEDYLTRLLADSKTQTIITQKKHADRFSHFSGKILFIEEIDWNRKSKPVDYKNSGYVIYTSGSTGEPKAVEVGIEALLNSTLARVETYGKVIHLPLVHSVSFDVATGCIFWSLLSGGTLHIYKDKMSELDKLVVFLQNSNISHFVFPTSLLGAFLDQVSADKLPHLKSLMVGGERWPAEFIQKHAEKLPAVSLYNEYGPTEACVWSSVGLMYDGETKKIFDQTIGKPILNTEYHILNGELYISGSNLARGYWGKSELTRDRFVALSGESRAYKTGDLVEKNSDGTYVFKGRVDRQIKVQGYRVEAGEIESALLKYPSISQAYVTVDQVLIAFLKSSQQVPTDEVKTYLSKLLPQYMIPSVFVFVDELPVSANGKIDEKKLLKSVNRESDTSVKPESAEEARLCEEISEIIRFEIKNPMTSLKELGANSLIYVRISAMLKAQFQASISVSQLFDAPHIRSIYNLVKTSQHKAPISAPQIAKIHDTKIPLSFQQKQIWFLHQLSPTSKAYHAQFSLRLKGPLELDLLQKALDGIIERHEILRTTFENIDGVGFQIIQKPWKPEINVVDLSLLHPSEKEGALRKKLDEAMDVNFDVSKLPLAVWHFYKLADQEHVLFQIEHHFIHDGWSGSILLTEIRDLYFAETRKIKPTLPALEIQYKDFAYWQEKWMSSDEANQQSQYWLAKLKGAKDGVTLPHSLSKEGGQTFNGECLRTDISAETVEKLLKLSRTNGTTLFAIFLSAFGLLSWKYTDESDFIVGSAFSNRRVPGLQNLLGMFVNALPLRVTINSEYKLKDLVEKTMKTLLEAQDHQEFPLIEIIRRLDVVRDQRKNPLFQLMFAFHDSPMPLFQVGDLIGKFKIEHNHSAKNDINVVCMPHPALPDSGLSHNGVSVIWEYNKELYDRETTERFLNNFLHIVTMFAEKWSQPISSIDLMSFSEKKKILEVGQGPKEEFPFKLLHEGFEFQLKSKPNSVALIQKNTRYTFSEIDLLAQKIESSFDFKNQSVIAVGLKKSPGLLAALIAVLRNGHIYVSLDFNQPFERIEKILKDSKAVALVCDNETSDKFTDLNINKINISELKNKLSTKKDIFISPTDPAYFIYTSGSTGIPKAVVASHSNAMAAVNARTAYFGNIPPKTLVVLPIYFDVAGSMVFWTLGLGGTVVFPDSDDVRDPEVVTKLVEDHSVTHINFVASFYAQLLHSFTKPWKTTLSTVAIGGEPCTPEMVRMHAEKIPTAGLHNEYGPTEGTVWCSAQTVYSPEKGIVENITIGCPLANYSMFVIGKRGEPLPIGVLGELCIGGDGISLNGYLNDELLNQKKFINTEFGRLYRSGDEATAIPTGEFNLKGRLDDQIKIRGFRIELGEIVKIIQSHAHIKEAFCVVDKTFGQPIIAAYVSLQKDQKTFTRAEQIKDFIKSKLPYYMVPASVTILESLPLNQTGKVDRSRLPAPTFISDCDEKAMPETPSQMKLVSIWKIILGQDNLGIDDDFFENGGDSLLAIRVVAKAKAAGIIFTVSQLLRDRTIRKLLETARIENVRLKIPRAAMGATAPLTPIQNWFFENVRSGIFKEPDYFLQSRLFEIKSDANQSNILKAIEYVLQRHDVFRIAFEKNDSGWVSRVVSENCKINFGDFNLDSDPSVFQKIKKSIKIDGGPLFNVSIIKSKKQSYVMMALHHLIVDAVSWNILTDEIEEAYALLQVQKELKLRSAASIHASSWDSVSQKSNSESEKSVSKLKPDNDKGLAHFDSVYSCVNHISKSASDFISNELQRRFGISPLNFFLASYWKVLRNTLDFDSLNVLLEGHGRGTQSQDTNEVVGWFTDLFPALFECKKNADIYEMARCIESNPLVSKSEKPEITFNYLGQSKAHKANAILTISKVHTGSDIGGKNILPTLFDISVGLDHDKFKLRWSYSKNKFTDQLIKKLCDEWCEIIESACHVIPLTKSSSNEKAFFIHPIGGGVDWYENIANKLSTDVQVFGIKQKSNTLSINETAQDYIREIKKLKPNGPYFIAGWSFGAMVAFEIATQLEGQGEVIGKLHLIDPPTLTEIKRNLFGLSQHFKKIMPQISEEKIITAIKDIKSNGAAEIAESLWNKIDYKSQSSSQEETDFVKEKFNFLVFNYLAMVEYSPQKQIQNIFISFSEDTCARGFNDYEGWHKVCKNIKVTTISGDHESMLESDKLIAFMREREFDERSY